MNDVRDKPEGAGKSEPTQGGDLERKRAAAADIARRLSALKQARTHPAGAPAPEHPAAPAGSRPSTDAQGWRAELHVDAERASRPHPMLQARAISEAARRQKAAGTPLDERAAREWAHDRPPQKSGPESPAPQDARGESRAEPAPAQPIDPNETAQPAFYGTAFSALLTAVAARPRIDIEHHEPKPAIDRTPSAPQFSDAVEPAPIAAAEPPEMPQPAMPASVADEPVAQAAASDVAMAEDVIADDEIVDEPVADERVVDEIVADEEIAEELLADEPVAEEPGADELDAHELGANELVVDEPVTEAPAADQPRLDEPMAAEPLVAHEAPDIAAEAVQDDAADAMPENVGETLAVAPETRVADADAVTDDQADHAPEEEAPDDAGSDAPPAPHVRAPLESQIAAAAERVAESAVDVTEDREPSLWAERAPILVARPAERLDAEDDAARFDVADDDDHAAEAPAWRSSPEQEATPYFHITELTQVPPRRRAHRAALLVGLVAVVGTAAGAAAILQSPLRAQSDPVAMVSAALGGSAMGRVAEFSAPDPQAAVAVAAATETPPPPATAEVGAQNLPSAPLPGTGPAAALPVTEPPAPAPMETLPEAPQVTAMPADTPDAEEEAAPQNPQPRPLANTLQPPMPQIAGANEIGDAPISMPQMPAGSTASLPAAPAEAVSSTAGASATPRVASKLKPNPAQAHVVTDPVAKPFVPTATQSAAKPAAKPKPASKPKVVRPAPGPIDQVLDALAPFMNGSKPQQTEWGKRK